MEIKTTESYLVFTSHTGKNSQRLITHPVDKPVGNSPVLLGGLEKGITSVEGDLGMSVKL